MIGPDAKDPTLRALYALSVSCRTWYPCGSRFFGDAVLASDFDFFSDELHNIDLLAAGFTLRPMKYKDQNTLAVYELGRVHAIIVKSVGKRLAAQKIIAKMPKKLRRHTSIWNAAYDEVASTL